MNAEFNWWLLIVGLVIGAGLIWLVLADGSRRDADVETRERASEARWIAEELRRAGRPMTNDDVADVLDLHAAYLSAPPPDEARGDEVAELAGPSAAADDLAALPQRRPITPAGGSARSDGDGLPV